MRINRKKLKAKHYVIGALVVVGLVIAFKKGFFTKFFALFKKKTV